MKQFFLFAILLLLLAIPSIAQNDQSDVVLPDSVMKDVLNSIVKQTIKPPAEQELVYIANMGLGSDWLPKIKNVDFVLLEKKANGGYPRDVYFWKNLRTEKGEYLVDFGYGDVYCSASGAIWSFKVVSDKVKDLHSTLGWGSGCASGSSSPKV